MQIGLYGKLLTIRTDSPQGFRSEMKFCPPKTSKTCRNVQKVAKSPFNVTAARFVFTGSPIIFSKSHKTTYGAAVKLRGHLPSASTRFYWCLEAFMDVSRQNNCVELPLDVHKSLSTPVKFVSAEVKTSSFDCCLINSYVLQREQVVLLNIVTDADDIGRLAAVFEWPAYFKRTLSLPQ